MENIPLTELGQLTQAGFELTAWLERHEVDGAGKLYRFYVVGGIMSPVEFMTKFPERGKELYAVCAAQMLSEKNVSELTKLKGALSEADEADG